MKEKILSIIIPTKNREEYLLEVVKNILSIKDNRFELVIQDNSDTQILREKLSVNGLLKDERLKYFYSVGTLSFVDNFSRGISNSHGEFIIFIGDDDTINPNIIDVAEWASKNQIDAITPSLPYVYFWPQTGMDAKIETGRLAISKYKCSKHFYNPKEELRKLLKNGAQNYLSYNLAKAYHGLVRAVFFDQIKNITGRYIGGLSPDIYLSVGLSLLIDKVMVIDYPLTISGICKKSGSADSVTGKHTGKLEEAPHFKGQINYSWAKQIPKFYSVETIWGDSALHAINDINPDFLTYFNVNVICAYCLIKYPEFRNIIYENLFTNNDLSKYPKRFNWHLLRGFLSGPVKSTSFSIYNKIFDKMFNHNKVKIFYYLSDIHEAMEIIKNDLNKNKLFLK